MVRIPYRPEFIFRLSFRNYKSCVYNCVGLLYILIIAVDKEECNFFAVEFVVVLIAANPFK